MKRIAIVGCRPPTRASDDGLYDAILWDVARFIRLHMDGVAWVVSGGAKGVDTFAVDLASDLFLNTVVFLPDYARHGRRAPLERNALIVAHCDELHAWPAPWSRGTWDSIRKAKALGKPVTVHEVKL